jgi:hypothetical protein
MYPVVVWKIVADDPHPFSMEERATSPQEAAHCFQHRQ